MCVCRVNGAPSLPCAKFRATWTTVIPGPHLAGATACWLPPLESWHAIRCRLEAVIQGKRTRRYHCEGGGVTDPGKRALAGPFSHCTESPGSGQSFPSPHADPPISSLWVCVLGGHLHPWLVSPATRWILLNPHLHPLSCISPPDQPVCPCSFPGPQEEAAKC